MIIWAFFLLKELISSLNISQAQLVEDFQELRRTLEAMNMFSANLGFFSLHLIQILILEVLAWLMLWHFGNGWPITICISFLLTISQVSRYPKPRQWLWGEGSEFLLLSLDWCQLLLDTSWQATHWCLTQQIIKACWAQVLLTVKWGITIFL